MLPAVEAVVEVMRQGLLPEQFQGEVIAIRVDPRRDRFPLVIAFGTRATARPDVEVAASALFRCEADGRVYGYRYPFHSVKKGLDPERFMDLGEPEGINAEVLGDAVAVFLQWATVGSGCGGHRLVFGAPPTLPFVRPQVKRAFIAA
jgi:hypothetical protein